MQANVILYHDWDDYDKRKMREHRSSQVFSCDQDWELRYLASKIKLLYPDLDEGRMHKAIKSCCSKCSGTPSRSTFVHCVIMKLQ